MINDLCGYIALVTKIITDFEAELQVITDLINYVLIIRFHRGLMSKCTVDGSWGAVINQDRTSNNLYHFCTLIMLQMANFGCNCLHWLSCDFLGYHDLMVKLEKFAVLGVSMKFEDNENHFWICHSTAKN